MKFFPVAVLATALAITALAADQKLGQPLTSKESITLSTLYAKPDPLVGKTVQVKAKVTEVCLAMGCWMSLADSEGHTLRIKVDDGVIVFPKDSVGKTAIAEGKLAKIQMTREQAVDAAKEEAEETGRKFDPASIKYGKTIYELAGSGAVIFDK